MTETRTTSSTGGEKGVKPEAYSLLPRTGLDAVARVYAFGAQKYAADNWRRGYEWRKSLDAALRHIYAFADGETNDPESGEPHPAHAVFHMLTLITWLAEQGEGADNPFDDRWPASMERARREKEAEEEGEDEDFTFSELYEFPELPDGYHDALGKAFDRALDRLGIPPEAEVAWKDPEVPMSAAIQKMQDATNEAVARQAMARNGFALARQQDDGWLAGHLSQAFIHDYYNPRS